MKIAKPISVAPPSHKDDDWFLPRPGFNEDLRREVKALAKLGVPVTMRGGKLFYRNKKDGVQFSSIIADLEAINQGRSLWVLDAFEKQIWVERVLKSASVLELENLDQNDRGVLYWRWHGRDFGAYWHRRAFLCLRISDGENYRQDLFDLKEDLIPDILLQCIRRSDRALTAQFKLKDFFEKKDVVTIPVPNGLEIGPVHIHVELDDIYSYSLKSGTESEETVNRNLSYLDEFKASEGNHLKVKGPIVPMTVDDLDLI